MEENVTTIEAPKKRPTFLTVLCILSLIGSGGLGLLYSVYQYATFESTYPAQMEKLTTAMDQLEQAGMDSGFFYKSTENGIVVLEKMSQNLGLITGVNCLFALLSLLGVFMMFKLKKNGFYLYTIVNYFWVLVPLVLIDFDASMTNSLIGGAVVTLFVILYAVQLKHMD
ncbi:hypothetical protein QUH73_11960 [Labilibaculum sp. K2S]|uniref:hypothetical protein n=1 Tax=Labilibaculum sp. K2S TaxID=3056386 RepID=UPI0025A441C1|nr:hypothetical protein [Labilibaculum sp. K2S]MDM8160532.1 hypothetical protein [Labilibaculum sp. K2S]